MDHDDDSSDRACGARYDLPKHVRFARSLALVAGAAIGVAAGAAVFGATGCGSACIGICGPFGVAPMSGGPDASSDGANDGTTTGDLPDRAGDGATGDGAMDAGAGGGPRHAPTFPAAWLA